MLFKFLTRFSLLYITLLFWINSSGWKYVMKKISESFGFFNLFLRLLISGEYNFGEAVKFTQYAGFLKVRKICMGFFIFLVD